MLPQHSHIKLLHPNLLYGIKNCLEIALFSPKAYADKVIERCFKAQKKWGKKDRATVAEIFYGIIRWKRRLEFYVTQPISEENLYHFILIYLEWAEIEYEDFREFNGYKIPIFKKEEKKSAFTAAVRQSVPDWIYQAVAEDFPKPEHILSILNSQAPLCLRINRLKINDKDFQAHLEEKNIRFFHDEEFPDAYILANRQNIFKEDMFKEGYVEVQDAGSQKIARFLDPQPGTRIIDACAGGGGKSLHIASLMENKGQILAMDIHEWKLTALKLRARRNGAHNIETRAIEGSKTIKRIKHSADKLLLDVPCSGLGVLKRNPDTKWKITPDSVSNLIKTQREILESYHELLKPGGEMVYATCSILSDENERQIKYFLANHPEYELIAEEHIIPSPATDGFYMAKLKHKI